MNQIPYTKEQLFRANVRLMEKNKRYLEAIRDAIDKISSSLSLDSEAYEALEILLEILDEALEESE